MTLSSPLPTQGDPMSSTSLPTYMSDSLPNLSPSTTELSTLPPSYRGSRISTISQDPPPSAGTPSISPPGYRGSYVSNTVNESRLEPVSNSSQRVVLIPPDSKRNLTIEQQIKEFEHDIKRKGKTIASVTILADAAYSKNVPTYIEGLPLKGRVYLDLDTPEAIYSVVVSIQGKIIPSADIKQQQLFLDISKILWSTEQGLPRRINNINDSAALVTAPSKSSEKLYGEYTWNFAIELPQEVSVSHGTGSGKTMGVFSLPQTFIERESRASVSYEISVRFGRGKWKTDYLISTNFGYIPISRPPLFAAQRQLSYQENTPLPGPTIDAEGWHRADQVSVNGHLFDNRAVTIKCTLYIAKPLVYTRGSLIPLSICLEGEDQQSLDLLSASKAIVIRLRRRVRYYFDSPNNAPGNGEYRYSLSYSDPAVIWPSSEGAEDPSKRCCYINGELYLKPDLKPTSAMADFRVEYSIMLFPFQSPGFETEEDKSLIEHPVDIVTFYAPGPRPRRYAPPNAFVSDHTRAQNTGQSLLKAIVRAGGGVGAGRGKGTL